MYQLNAAGLPAQKEMNPCWLRLAHDGRRKWTWLKNVRWKKEMNMAEKCQMKIKMDFSCFQKKDKTFSFQFSKADSLFQSQQNTVKKHTAWQVQNRQMWKGGRPWQTAKHKIENDRQSAKHCKKQYYKHKADKCQMEKGRDKQQNTRQKTTDRQTW